MSRLEAIVAGITAVAVFGILAVSARAVPAGVGDAGAESITGEVPERVQVPDKGIPVTSDAVVASCSSCHAVDSAGRMSRISFLRKTPEGWQRSLRRMTSLYGVQVDSATARRIVRYLADDHGIAPAELRPALFEVERVRTDYEYPDEEVRETCGACHSMGRVVTQRRTAEEWELLAETHRGLYPIVDRQTFEEDRDEEGRYAVDRANAHLAERYPLRTSTWAEWSANVRPPRLEGTWVLSGIEDGHGPVHGRVEITPVPDRPREFTHRTSYVRAATGESVSRSGRAVVYTGYQWRGRSGDGEDALREVMFVERGWREMHGRWFAGAYDEIGTEVQLRRAGGDVAVSGVHPRALRSGVEGQEVTVYGVNLPESLSAADLDFGPGVRVAEVIGGDGDEARVVLDVEASAAVGDRDLSVGAAAAPSAVVVYDRVHSVRVEPRAGMARIGGIAYPKEHEYFRAVGYHDGPDGEPETDDDLRLGPVPVEWSLAEYPVTYEDDDVEFVGSMDENGRFTPAADGPNPERSGNRNNVGEVWVVATHRPEGEGADAPVLRGRGYLVVTVPLYMRFESWPSMDDDLSARE